MSHRFPGGICHPSLQAVVWSGQVSEKVVIEPLGEIVDAVVLNGPPNALAIGRRCAMQGF